MPLECMRPCTHPLRLSLLQPLFRCFLSGLLRLQLLHPGLEQRLRKGTMGPRKGIGSSQVNDQAGRGPPSTSHLGGLHAPVPSVKSGVGSHVDDAVIAVL